MAEGGDAREGFDIAAQPSVMPAAVKRCRVQASFFDDYWRDIGTIRSFYEAHLDLVKPEAPFNFYDSEWPFFTHPRFLPGSRLTDCRFHRTVLAGGGDGQPVFPIRVI